VAVALGFLGDGLEVVLVLLSVGALSVALSVVLDFVHNVLPWCFPMVFSHGVVPRYFPLIPQVLPSM